MLYAHVPTPWDPTKPPKNQIISGAWGRLRWQKLVEEPPPLFFRFQDRRWNLALDVQKSQSFWDIKPSQWMVLPDEDYFPRSLRRWLKGRMFRMIRFRGSGAGLALSQANGYITEDGQLFYVAEDGDTFYVQET